MFHEDQSEWEQEVRETEMQSEVLDEQLRSLSEDPVIDYLGRNGDAIQERVDRCTAEASALHNAGFHGAALVRATAGMEIVIKFFLARPLLQGAFLSDTWAQALANRIIRPRSTDDRDLLPAILRNWDIDIAAIRTKNGALLWQSVKSTVWPRRNDYVHAADVVAAEDSSTAIDCLEAILHEVVKPIAIRLGFTREQSGCWSEIVASVNGTLISQQSFIRTSPFSANAA
jgi:hypothetical protein